MQCCIAFISVDQYGSTLRETLRHASPYVKHLHTCVIITMSIVQNRLSRAGGSGHQAEVEHIRSPAQIVCWQSTDKRAATWQLLKSQETFLIWQSSSSNRSAGPAEVHLNKTLNHCQFQECWLTLNLDYTVKSIQKCKYCTRVQQQQQKAEIKQFCLSVAMHNGKWALCSLAYFFCFSPEAPDDISRVSEKKREEMTIHRHGIFHLFCCDYWRRQRRLSVEQPLMAISSFL